MLALSWTLLRQPPHYPVSRQTAGVATHTAPLILIWCLEKYDSWPEHVNVSTFQNKQDIYPSPPVNHGSWRTQSIAELIEKNHAHTAKT